MPTCSTAQVRRLKTLGRCPKPRPYSEVRGQALGTSSIGHPEGLSDQHPRRNRKAWLHHGHRPDKALPARPRRYPVPTVAVTAKPWF